MYTYSPDFDRSHPVVFCNNIVIWSVKKHNIFDVILTAHRR